MESWTEYYDSSKAGVIRYITNVIIAIFVDQKQGEQNEPQAQD